MNRINKIIQYSNCNFDNAKRIADSLFNSRINDIKEYDVSVFENDTCYSFSYSHKKDANVIWKGGGGRIAISKMNCKVIIIIAYQ